MQQLSMIDARLTPILTQSELPVTIDDEVLLLFVASRSAVNGFSTKT